MQTRTGTALCGAVELFYEDLGDPGDQAGLRRASQRRRLGALAGCRGPQHLGHQLPQLPAAGETLRRRVEELRDRSDYPQGIRRQFDAILGTGSPLRYTRRIAAPTVVIHGTDDPMVRPRNGRNLARAVPGARFVVVDGMGHDLPEPVWRPIVEALTENFGVPADG